MDFFTIEKMYQKEHSLFEQDKGQLAVYQKLLKEKDEQIQAAEKEIDVLQKTQSVFLTLGEKQREAVKNEFEEIVTNALQYIMQEEIYFEIEIKELRGVPNIEFYIRTVRDGITTKTTISESRGDGIADIVTLALNIAVFINQNPKNEGPLILDEPCRQVSEKYKAGVGLFLREIAEVMDIQIFMITHIEKYVDCADNKFKVFLSGTSSVVNSL